MERKPTRVSRRSGDACKKKNPLYDVKYLFPFAVIAFVSAFIIARTYSALQRAGIILVSPNIIGEFHLHHWAIALIALVILAVFFVLFRSNKVALFYIIILMAFFIGLFIDGIVYIDSVQFFEG